MNVAGEAWRATGTDLRWAIWCRSCVLRCTGSTRSVALSGSPYTSSADDACRSALNAVPQSNAGLHGTRWRHSGSGGSVPRVRWLWGDERLSGKGECHWRPLYHWGKSPWYPLGRRLGLELVLTMWSEKPWPDRDSNSNPLVLQPVASRYTDCTTAKRFLQ
jgi:hypothetical protein